MKELIFPYSKNKVTLDVADNVPTLNITENGEYSVKGYDKALVNVSGGSGSSDFTTAVVTVSTNGSCHLNNAIVVDTENDELNPEGWLESGDYTLVLYKGKIEGGITAPDGMVVTSASGTGGVSVSEIRPEFFKATITGDGTLTVEITSES